MNSSKNFNDINNLIKKDKIIWDIFTKKEEYNLKITDKYGRASYKSSNFKNIINPIVSKYLTKKGLNTEYEDGKKFAIFLSHDIDDINMNIKQLMRSSIPYPSNKQKLSFLKFLSSYIKKQKSYINFKEIIELEKKYNATSTFYFLASERDVFGIKYNLENIQNEISYIIEQDCEIGLHTSFEAYNNLGLIKQEKQKLESLSETKIMGARNHLFNFKIPETWTLLSKAGFEYDSTYGYHDMVGFRNGLCHPFKPFDLGKNHSIDIIEIPPCIVDITLFSYMKLDAAKSWDLIKKLIDDVEKLGGVITILWHNWTYSYPISYAGLFGKEWTKLYEKILDYGNRKNALLTNGKNITKNIGFRY